MRLLLVEDSLRRQKLLADALQRTNYEVDAVATVAALLNNIAVARYDLIIIDLGLPDGDGLGAVRTLRSLGYSTPILIMTARGSIEERVIGLDSGADDYLIKPFNDAELLACVRALATPIGDAGTRSQIRWSRARRDQGEVSYSGKPIGLRLSGRRLLAKLMRRSGRIAPKSTLEDALSEIGRELSTNAVEVLASRLRKALSERSAGVSIETVRGTGYRLRLIEQA